MGNYREFIKDKKRIVIKIGSSSLMHEQTGRLDLLKIEKLVRILIDIKNSGKDVVLVSSGAIAVGRAVIGLCDRPTELPVKQACASIGQAKLMMVYQKIFAEYGAVASQVLLTKNTIVNDVNRTNAQNTFNEILKLGAVPIVNENDTVSTYEIEQLQAFGDNDRLSAIVASIIGADLLILLSDIDGLYTDDPNTNPNAKFVETVYEIDEKLMGMVSSICDTLMTHKEFTLPHRSFIVNMNYIKTIDAVRIELTNSKTIPVAQRRVSDIKKQYLDFQMEE